MVVVVANLFVVVSVKGIRVVAVVVKEVSLLSLLTYLG